MFFTKKHMSCSLLLLSLLPLLQLTQANIDMSNINVNDLQQQLPVHLGNTTLSLDDAKTLFKEKCIKVAGEELGNQAYEEIEKAAMTLSECFADLANHTVIQLEIEEAKPRGELDVVFNKYCKKRPDAMACAEAFNEKLMPCLDKEEQDNKEVFMRIVRSLLDFVCHKGGDQIALFIAEKGPECLESKRDEIQQCLNNTLSPYLPKEGFDKVESIPKLVMGQPQCTELMQLETCIVQHLEQCSEITPANIVESMFRFIKNETICRTSPSRLTADQSGKSVGVASTSACSMLILMLLAVLLLVLRQ